MNISTTTINDTTSGSPSTIDDHLDTTGASTGSAGDFELGDTVRYPKNSREVSKMIDMTTVSKSNRADILIAIDSMMQRRVELKAIDRQLTDAISVYLKQLDESTGREDEPVGTSGDADSAVMLQHSLEMTSQIIAMDLSAKSIATAESALSNKPASKSVESMPTARVESTTTSTSHCVNLRKSRLLGSRQIDSLGTFTRRSSITIDHTQPAPGASDCSIDRSTSNNFKCIAASEQADHFHLIEQYRQWELMSLNHHQFAGEISLPRSTSFPAAQFDEDVSDCYKRQRVEFGAQFAILTKRLKTAEGKGASRLLEPQNCPQSLNTSIHQYHHYPSQRLGSNAHLQIGHAPPSYHHQQMETTHHHQVKTITPASNSPADSYEQLLRTNVDKSTSLVSHKPMSFRCHVCGSGFEDRHRLQQHLSIHLSLHPSWFEEKTIKETMAQYESRRGDYLCTICSLRYGTTAEFDRHMQLHGEKPHQCELCVQDNKMVSFRYYRQLLTHLRSHCFLYSCRFAPDCKQTANRKDYLKLHILKHHLNNKLPEQCTACCH